MASDVVGTSQAGRTSGSFIRYIERTREHYLSRGYDNPYAWASFDSVPFNRLSKPLSECTLALLTTASLPRDSELPPGTPMQRGVPRPELYSAPTDPAPQRLHTADRSWDKGATHTDDLDSYFPIHRLQEFVRAGRLGALASRFHGPPTVYSRRQTMEQDAPEILRRCREDGVDVALLVPL